MLEKDGTCLLFDPFIPLNNKLYQPKIEELALSEHILITHGHFDHIIDIPKIVKQSSGNIKIFCTAKPRETLIKKGVEEKHIQQISPGVHFNIGPFSIRVLKGRHVIFDKGLVIKTLFSPRIIMNWKNLFKILRSGKGCDEAGETVVYDICVADMKIFFMGSLNLDDNTEYPIGADLLVLPFQGRSDINNYALRFIQRLQPKKVLLSHFDDSFPPISSAVNTDAFYMTMKKEHPDISVIRLCASDKWVEI